MKLTTKQNWFITLVAITLLFSLPSKAQVTIGDQKTPQSFSILELVSGNKGLRLPQIVSTAQRDATITNSSGFRTDPLSLGLQIYNLETKQVETWDGSKWVGSHPNAGEAIWLPSTDFPWGSVGQEITVNLFNVYAKAFKSTATHNTDKYFSSTGAAVNVAYHNDDVATSFHYVITDYDDKAIQITSLNGNGEFRYRILKTNSENAWVSILLVRK